MLLTDWIDVVKKRMTCDGGVGWGHWLKDSRGDGTASTFAMEALHFSAIPYPVHSWMLVVVQRP